ncbi:LOW QUALITY PROTEIN: protein phosphatase 1 regulatory subunit 35-like [Phodopus roborovskii]|uniref:LOW QUALITY PROTEIN: protein phosphatase 1 regulatory subunit 35-like n=1 Tax=Phodopus roborovskii TaxID=109678 RepID=UPI0021E43ED3|nr:LOW QUALITY PROTEIN: protein phosphatase 1 regulatory subunit 35-like [Phodopus roborovskii]
MMGYRASELESMEGEEAVGVPGPAPEPRAPEPLAPEPEPGLDLSLSPSPLPESPERQNGSPGRRRGRRGGRRGRQVRFHLAPSSPVRSEPLLEAGVPSEDPAAPHELEAPALQSSLALSLELQNARAAVASGQFDASKAVEEQLRKSFQTRCALEETVAEGLNVPRSKRLYRDLVSLQVPEEQVLNAALREKLAMLPPQPRAPPPKEVLGQGPDMTVLCNPDSLCYESPHLTVDGLPPLRLQARPRPSEDTFLMHRMLRRWEA